MSWSLSKEPLLHAEEIRISGKTLHVGNVTVKESTKMYTRGKPQCAYLGNLKPAIFSLLKADIITLLIVF